MKQRRAQPALDANDPPTASKAVLVLIVDDFADNREMYALYLRLRGFCVIPCADSRDAVDLALAWVPDIILLELRMNGLNGLDVLARLQREPTLAAVPVVALTASVLSFEQAAAMAAGFTALAIAMQAGLPVMGLRRVWPVRTLANSSHQTVRL